MRLVISRLLLTLLLILSHQWLKAQYCEQNNRFTEVSHFPLSAIESRIDIEYGAAKDYQDNETTLYLDAYFPDTTIDPLAKRPAVLLIHGGAFIGGNKDNRKTECIVLAQRGYAAFTMSYRLGWNQSDSTTQVLAMYRAHQDAHAALRYLVEHHDTFAIDTNQIFVGGTSAGAITANNVHYTDQNEWNIAYPGIQSILGSLDTSGNDYVRSFDLKAIFNNWGAVPQETIELSEMVPQVAFHGALDPTVEIDSAKWLMGSRSIHQTLVDNNVCADITVDPMGLHGIYTNLSGSIFRASKASCFFRSVMCHNCTSVSVTDSIAPSCSNITSVHENEWPTYKVFPNPTTHHIQIKGLIGDENCSVYNAQRLQIAHQVDCKKLSTLNLATGIYIIHIYRNEKHYTLKLVKE